MNVDEIKRQATRAARKGDIAKLDELEIAYMKAAGIPLTKEDPTYDEGCAVIPAQPVRLFRGAGPNGETRVQWVRFDGVHVMSDIEGHLVDCDDEQPALFSLAEAA
ncbi:hypothetical protein CF68_33260 [Cupriavidus sp. SK-4]|uniref:hypothetical protein n=1 Tax=Cupriavidus sp. SK-4 TaxID=574750 RepID=UPI000445F02B|nr:hypothetical protein [Cupriavidus sp. SK-4]EYS89547.1 hypothetical protein CF68_33260 [Cupriavidus sp. SK-4]